MSIFDLLDSPEKQKKPDALHPIEQDRRWKIEMGVAYLQHAYKESIGSVDEAEPTNQEPKIAEPVTTPLPAEDYSFDITNVTPEQLAQMHRQAEAQAIGYLKDENNIHISRN